MKDTKTVEDEIKKEFTYEFAFANRPLEEIKGTDITKICNWWLNKIELAKAAERKRIVEVCENLKQISLFNVEGKVALDLIITNIKQDGTNI